MKLLTIILISLVSSLSLAERLTFDRTFSTEDTACCGDRWSEVSFNYTYIFDDNQKKSARAACKGFWNASTMELMISDSLSFNLQRSRIYEAEFEDHNICLWKLKEISKAKPESPFIFDPEETLSVFGDPTNVRWERRQ